jgi:hypothetical protein
MMSGLTEFVKLSVTPFPRFKTVRERSMRGPAQIKLHFLPRLRTWSKMDPLAPLDPLNVLLALRIR